MQERQDLLDALGRVPTILSAFMADIPSDQLDRRRGNGFWTISEHLSHLAQVQPMLLERIQRFLDEDHPEFVPFIPRDDQGELDTTECMAVEAALAQFSAERKRQLNRIERADEQTWERQATHPEYDQYGFHVLVRHILMHDYWHMYRMEELWLTKTPFLTRLE
jgi:uncharacterized damage-inducible protein DinB